MLVYYNAPRARVHTLREVTIKYTTFVHGFLELCVVCNYVYMYTQERYPTLYILLGMLLFCFVDGCTMCVYFRKGTCAYTYLHTLTHIRMMFYLG